MQEGLIFHADSEYRTQKIARPLSRELWPIFAILTRMGIFVDFPIQRESILALCGVSLDAEKPEVYEYIVQIDIARAYKGHIVDFSKKTCKKR